MVLIGLVSISACSKKSINVPEGNMKGIKVAASATDIVCDDSMVIAGSIHPHFARGQEGKIRASAVVIESGETKLCIVSCDVLMFERDIIDDVGGKIEAECGIPFENILVSATHTHHAPSTVTIHGYSRDDVFCERLKDAVLSAVSKANKKLKTDQNAQMYFWLGQESSVGQNSRLLLKDNTIFWIGPRDDVLRPTGPFDPELPVLAFKKADGSVEALLFNHSTHNIGARRGGVRSPGFYGLAAQELEEELGGTGLLLLGAAGSTHNLTLSADEMVLRIKNAVKEALSKAQKREVSGLKSVKEGFEYRVRKFNEAKEEEAVSYYCNKRAGGGPESTIEAFRKMRKELAPHQGEVRKTWLQVMLIGDVALVGVPGEFFTSLGVEIKRRSPFRYTYIVELANDYIGYIPDEEGYSLGGYQVWTGFHSLVEKGTGEAIVNEAVQILTSLHTPL
jgi:neutral ceramidase